ncbi:MAG: class I SAM-dependent methyltransferase [Thermoleophilaceae bacterium]|nr:class I SAM-dependent methyltransferase [Thermoleophilaceae bacterium]
MLNRLLKRRGAAVPTGELEGESPAHLDAADRRILDRAMPYTMTGSRRLLATIDSARYCIKREIPGAFVECGVWRGGSVLAMILVLQEAGIDDRDLYLYDTFEGMTEPTALDVSPIDRPALETWRDAVRRDEIAWPELFGSEASGESGVRETLLSSGYPAERIHLVKGPVEVTLPGTMPDRLALLRLDTDWYESTRHELVHLYPRLSQAGVLIVDDYGHWEGARRAVDEYFADLPPQLLNRIDYTGRLAVKC